MGNKGVPNLNWGACLFLRIPQAGFSDVLGETVF